MGDYTGFSITVYRMTRKRKRFTAAIEEVLSEVYSDTERDEAGRLIIPLGDPIQSGDVRCGTVSELAPALIDIDPDAIWEMSEDPKYEWLGEVAKYHPDTGLFTGDCSSTGHALLTRERLVAAGVFIDPSSDGWGAEMVREAQRRLNELTGALQDAAIRDYVRETWPAATT